MTLLDQVNGPADIKKIPLDKLPELAKDVREKIIEVTSQVGGHLGAGLGTVELAIALHYVFDSPTDKMVWDTGHQAYPHKLLTGRRDRFHTLRQFTREQNVRELALAVGFEGTVFAFLVHPIVPVEAAEHVTP